MARNANRRTGSAPGGGGLLADAGRTVSSPSPKPDGSAAIVLDHAGNAGRHGHPADLHLWSLEGRPARLAAEAAERRAREIEELERRAAEKPLELGGRLVELTAGDFDALRLRQMPLRRALRLGRTDEDVRRLGRARGYKPGWAWPIIRERCARASA